MNLAWTTAFLRARMLFFAKNLLFWYGACYNEKKIFQTRCLWIPSPTIKKNLFLQFSYIFCMSYIFVLHFFHYWPCKIYFPYHFDFLLFSFFFVCFFIIFLLVNLGITIYILNLQHSSSKNTNKKIIKKHTKKKEKRRKSKWYGK